MSHRNYAEYPQCRLITEGDDELKELFWYWYIKPQSWCKSYRNCSSRMEALNVWDATEIWMSNSIGRDYSFNYSEDDLKNTLW